MYTLVRPKIYYTSLSYIFFIIDLKVHRLSDLFGIAEKDTEAGAEAGSGAEAEGGEEAGAVAEAGAEAE
jgi:hypothetical protein